MRRRKRVYYLIVVIKTKTFYIDRMHKRPSALVLGYLTEDSTELTHEVMHSLCSDGFSTGSLLLDLPDPNNVSRGGGRV